MTTEARPVMDTATFTFPVKLPPQSHHPNSRAHWRRKWKEGQWYAIEVLWWIQAAQRQRLICDCRFARARIDLAYQFSSGRKRDGDNLIAWSKPLIDNLKRRFLVDDDLDHLEIGSVTATVKRGAEPFVSVTLTGVLATDTARAWREDGE